MSHRSIQAYREALSSGKKLNAEQQVYRMIDRYQSINLDGLREKLYLRHQTLTSALSTLEDSGLISQHDNGAWRICATEKEQHEQIIKRRNAKFQRWLHAGEAHGFFTMHAILLEFNAAQGHE